MHFSRIVAVDTGTNLPDHALIAAAAAVRQARTRTARAAATLDRPTPIGRPGAAAIVAVLRADGGRARGGSFHPDFAAAR